MNRLPQQAGVKVRQKRLDIVAIHIASIENVTEQVYVASQLMLPCQSPEPAAEMQAELYGEPGRQATISFMDNDDQAGEVTLTFAPRTGKQTEISPDLPPAHVEYSAYRLTPEIGYLELIFMNVSLHP